jgi:NTP pyrophosphatase (non-canonical NTP hydrolase)
LSADFTLDEYQVKAHHTAVYKTDDTVAVGDPLDHDPVKQVPVYPFLKVATEAAETSEKVIKVKYRGDFLFVPKRDLIKELGDILWYVAEGATILGVPLSEIALTNLDKLAARAKTGAIKGHGDER